jgi:hypothetical protein
MCAHVNSASIVEDFPSFHLRQSLVLSFPAELHPEGRFLLILDGFFDESGTHDASNTISVAGYLSTPDRWCDFNREWKAALDEYGLEFFHMTDFVAHREIYEHWSETERGERIARLIGIINRNVVASVGFALPLRDYYSTFSKSAKRYSGGPYGLAATSCFMDASRAIEPTGSDAKIAYIFEGGVKGKGQVMKAFDRSYEDAEVRKKHRLLSLGYKDKRDFRPLQAADILAYELYRHLPIQLGEIDAPTRQSLLALRNCPINYWKTFGTEGMREFAIVIDAAAKLYGPNGPKVKKRRG